MVPYTYRREILVRLVEECVEEMKNYKDLRIADTDPRPYRKRPASSSESDQTSPKRPRIDVTSTSSLSLERRDPSISKGKQAAR